ncbi:MAG: F0F1 ATP synthase subunit alpha, partial [Gemmatimonadaceae bacterium]
EFSPVSVPEQILVLLALGSRLLDDVPLTRMIEAQQALFDAAKNIPDDVVKRLTTADKLSDEDRKALTVIITQSLKPFHPKPKTPDVKAS